VEKKGLRDAIRAAQLEGHLRETIEALNPADPVTMTERTSDLRSSLADRRFEYVVAMDLLDRSCASQLLTTLYALLVPGGEMVFYEGNPWNPVHKLGQVSSAELVSDNLRGFLRPTGSTVVCWRPLATKERSQKCAIHLAELLACRPS
jgi:hypothetical protein